MIPDLDSHIPAIVWLAAYSGMPLYLAYGFADIFRKIYVRGSRQHYICSTICREMRPAYRLITTCFFGGWGFIFLVQGLSEKPQYSWASFLFSTIQFGLLYETWNDADNDDDDDRWRQRRKRVMRRLRAALPRSHRVAPSPA